MAYFDCIVGGSGKGNTLVVTCADELAGATITCTNGTKTYTKTCPSTAPYEVTFYGLAAGTYTVSATVSGNTYTTTVVVVDCAALLGGFNWRTWVDTAQFLDSSDYDSLPEVLEDELAIRELCLEHACVDYMAEITTPNADVETIINTDLFAKWVNNSDYALDFLYANEIIADYMDTADKYFYGEWVITDDTTTPPTWGAKGNVPAMTSNTAPYGTASASSEYSGYEAWKAFDGTENNGWSANTADGWIKYKFTNPTCIKALSFVRKYNTGNKFDHIELSISNDDVTYTVIKTDTLPNQTTEYNYKGEVDNSQYCLYVKLRGYGTTDWVWLDNLQFYGRELSVSVPTMTTNTAPYGEASGSSAATNAPIYNAFDENINTAWSSTTTLGWIQYQFINKIVPKMVGIGTLSSGSGRQALKGTVQAIVNGTSIDLKEFSVTEAVGQIAYIDIENDQDVEYDTLRLNITQSNVVNGNVTVNTFQIYGFDYSEKEFEEGVTKKWLYDHGVELEEITYSNGSSGTLPEKTDNSVILKAGSASSGSFSKMNVELNLIAFSLMRAKAVKFKNPSSRLNVQNTTESAELANISVATKDMPNNLYLDVSNINEVCHPNLTQASGANDVYEITEWWLE